MSDILRTTRKELSSFFGSPVAYLFIGAFLAACLFVFFWVESFFARNIADTRPLFDWMPLLLIFLAAALTMRLWSEERRAGTLEVLATLPVPTWKLVAGKFLAALALVTVALLLTMPLPVTVGILGELDWGPVLGAYLATLLLAAAYIAIGLFVSARTDNPIVALIGTTLLCALFYLIGSPALTALFGHGGGEVLRLFGTGARFESITRGVIDLRDLYYYLSLVGVFLALCIYSLERLRWAVDSDRQASHHRWQLITLLAAANLIAANLWLQQLGVARADLTEGKRYSVSDATRTYLSQLREPLLIRGYFSAETHALLAPLVPQLRDLLREYEVVGGPNVQVEFVDPVTSPELEREAGEQYGIRPVAFHTEGKYQSGVVNSYFDILVKYGDQFETLGFQDLIEVKAQGETDLDVRLRNPEYDLTRTIKKALYGYQGGGNAFAGIGDPIRFRGFISAADTLPEPLPGVRQDLEAVLSELSDEANRGGAERFDWQIVDPASDPAVAGEIEERFGFQPLVLGLLNPRPFYFYMVLEQGARAVPVPLPEGMEKASLARAIEAGIKRFAPGVLRTVALYTPDPAPAGFPGMPQQSGPGYTLLKETLREGFALRDTDLTTGQVPEDADLLFVVDPRALDEKQQFAVDQFLMQGGTVVVASSSFDVDLTGSRITAGSAQTGLEDWLAHQGVTMAPSLVMDPQNTPFPIPVQRRVGGFVVEEIQTLDYPYFPDVRAGGLAEDSGITANLGQITMNWSSPLTLDADKNAERQVMRLIESSRAAWTTESPDMQPDFEQYGALGFPVGEDHGRKLLAVSIEGRFESAFAGERSPLLPPEGATGQAAGDEGDAAEDAGMEPAAEAQDPAVDEVAGDMAAGEDAAAAEQAPAQPKVSAVVEHSPASARLIVIGSGSFLSDTAISLATQATQTQYLKPLEFAQNAVEWSLEDRGLLALRGRGQFSRLLSPVGPEARMFWENLNYALAGIGLALLYWLHRLLHRRRERVLTEMLAGGH